MQGEELFCYREVNDIFFATFVLVYNMNIRIVMRRFIVAIGAVLSFFGVSCQAQEAFRSVDVAEFERAVADDAYVVHT